MRLLYKIYILFHDRTDFIGHHEMHTAKEQDGLILWLHG